MKESSLLQVAALQIPGQKSRDDAFHLLKDQIAKAAKQGAQLILLPELHNGYYFCQTQDERYFDLAESIPGPSTDFFSQLAKEHQVVLVISIFEKRAKGIYHNTAVVIDRNGNIAGLYRKMHIPDDPGFYEKYYFTPGDIGFEPIQTSLGKLGVLVCWDQWFPEAARSMALKGAEILLYPTAIGWVEDDDAAEKKRQLNAWQLIQQAHAIANGIPVIVCNRMGIEKGIHFWGHSFIAGPQGEILTQADEKAQIITITIDLARSEKVRRMWPYLRDRRIDAYHDLLSRYID